MDEAEQVLGSSGAIDTPDSDTLLPSPPGVYPGLATIRMHEPGSSFGRCQGECHEVCSEHLCGRIVEPPNESLTGYTHLVNLAPPSG